MDKATPSIVADGPLRPEELADRLMPGYPQMSPDGRRVAFTVAPLGKPKAGATQAIWLSRDDAPAVPFTAGTAIDKEPRWSPDGRTLLFMSDRQKPGTFRLYRIPVDGGEARALGELEGNLRNPQWSPDGRRLAVLRRDHDSPEQQARKERGDDRVLFEAEESVNRLWIVDVETGAARQLTYGRREVWSYAWAANGASIGYVAAEAPGEDLPQRGGDLWEIPAAGGLPRHLAHFPVMPSHPTPVDRSGRPCWMVRAHGHRQDPAYGCWLVEADGTPPRNLIPRYPGNVDAITPIPSSPGKVCLRLVEGTHPKLWSLDVATGDMSPLSAAGFHANGSHQTSPSFDAAAERYAVVWADDTRPHEVYVARPDGEPHALTEFGKPFAGRLAPTEHVTWESEGVEIEGLLTRPPGVTQDRPMPLVVMVHGGPSWQWEDTCFLDWHDWTQMLASHGIAVLAPNPRGSTGRGSTFQQLLFNDVGGGEVHDLVNGALAMVERGVADPDRLGIGGWSWGGYLTARTITQTQIFKAAVMGAGMANLISDHAQGDIPHSNLLYFPGHPYHHLEQYLEASPIRHITRCTTPTLIVHGECDARVHPGQGQEMYRALKVIGVPVEFVRYPREGHAIEERAHQIDLMQRVLDWYTRWL